MQFWGPELLVCGHTGGARARLCDLRQIKH